jgi:hypothetical protein
VVDVNTKLTSFSTNHMTQILFGKRWVLETILKSSTCNKFMQQRWFGAWQYKFK